jgi:DNA repair protein RecO (recombination protein O)
MSIQTRGIVVQQIRYSDTSLIVKIYTEATGMVSFMVRGALKSGAKYRPALFMPLTLVELVFTPKPKKDLQFLDDLSIYQHLVDVRTNMQKNAIVLFISELLGKTIREHEANPSLFGFLFRSVQWLELVEGAFHDFHVYFSLELTRFLGFYPRLDEQGTRDYFDLAEGRFRDSPPPHAYFIAPPESKDFSSLCLPNPHSPGNFGFNNRLRRTLLQEILLYYRLHIPDFHDMKSPDVLRAVLG